MPKYITISGDMWDTIAYKTLGNERQTDELINLNTAYIDTYIFPAGIELEIPPPKPPPVEGLPPWKQSVLL
ncbi:hypothetical protein FACS18949_02810 [Clostridia bacterium]|nr:hypothetical protein FACS18949_02810 [Clostridia bacterium]